MDLAKDPNTGRPLAESTTAKLRRDEALASRFTQDRAQAEHADSCKERNRHDNQPKAVKELKDDNGWQHRQCCQLHQQPKSLFHGQCPVADWRSQEILASLIAGLAEINGQLGQD